MFGGTHPRTARRALRTGLAVLGVSAALAGQSGLAYADPGSPTVGGSDVTAKADQVTGVPSTTPGGHVVDTAGKSHTVSRIKLTLGTGGTVDAYCIDIKTNLQTGKDYIEGDWEKANPGSDMPHILWVLDHSFPNVKNPNDVLTAAGATLPVANADRVVYLATQAAVWHFSDKFQLGDGRGDLTETQSAAMHKVYKYLTGDNNTGMAEPAPSLEITPESLEGEVGKPIGPFEVKTTAETITLTGSEGAKLVDAAGKPVTSAANGDKFSVVLDKPGEATVDATGSGTVPIGRVFVFKQAADKGQKLVIASPSKVEVAAKVSVKATVAPSPTPTATPSASAAPSPSASPSPQPRPALANTGASPWSKIGIGVALVALGTALTVFTRRRRSAA